MKDQPTVSVCHESCACVSIKLPGPRTGVCHPVSSFPSCLERLVLPSYPYRGDPRHGVLKAKICRILFHVFSPSLSFLLSSSYCAFHLFLFLYLCLFPSPFHSLSPTLSLSSLAPPLLLFTVLFPSHSHSLPPLSILLPLSNPLPLILFPSLSLSPPSVPFFLSSFRIPSTYERFSRGYAPKSNFLSYKFTRYIHYVRKQQRSQRTYIFFSFSILFCLLQQMML